MGIALLVLALGLGAGLAELLAVFPLPILAGLLAVAGVLHIGLLRDLSGRCLLYTSPSPRDKRQSRMPSSA